MVARAGNRTAANTQGQPDLFAAAPEPQPSKGPPPARLKNGRSKPGAIRQNAASAREGAGPRFISVAQALTRYGIGRTKLYELIADDRIQARKLGAKTLIIVAVADAYFDALPPRKSGS